MVEEIGVPGENHRQTPPTADDENSVVSIGTATAFIDGGDEDDSDKVNVESSVLFSSTHESNPNSNYHIALASYSIFLFLSIFAFLNCNYKLKI